MDKHTKNSKILITGASGFVGQFLLDKLIKESNNNIIGLHKRKLPKILNERYSDKVNWVQCDLTKDRLNQILIDVEVVYHLAGYSTVGSSSEDQHLLDQVNVHATGRLAKACFSSQVRHFIFVSSISACETSSLTHIDETNGLPVTPYGESKKKAEELLMKIAKNSFNFTILRPTALFGEMHKGSIFELTKNLYKKRFVVFGSGKNLTNFYYIRDFIDLLFLVQNNNKTFNEIFIASDESYSLNTLVGWICDSLNIHYVFRAPLLTGYLIGGIFDIISNLTKKSLPFSLRRFRSMTRNVSYSNVKIHKTINFDHRYGVRSGLVRTIKWYQDAGAL